MARKLAHRGIQPDILLSSPALRALETAEFFRMEFQMSKSDVQVIPFLYEPTLQSFYDAIESIESKHNTALVFSHNPGITRLVHELECEALYDMPPCGMIGIQLLSDQWNDLRIAEKNFMFFDFPERG